MSQGELEPGAAGHAALVTPAATSTSARPAHARRAPSAASRRQAGAPRGTKLMAVSLPDKSFATLSSRRAWKLELSAADTPARSCLSRHSSASRSRRRSSASASGGARSSSSSSCGAARPRVWIG